MLPTPDRQAGGQLVQSTVQWGGRTHAAGGRALEGRTWDEFPIPAVRVPAGGGGRRG